MNDFQAEVVDILKEKAADIFGVDASTLDESTSFVDDLHCKSVNIVQFASALEDEYEVDYCENITLLYDDVLFLAKLYFVS